MAANLDESTLPLDQFVKLPTTVAFNVYNTDRFKLFAKNRPYLKLGTELASGYIVVYTDKSNIQMLFEELGHDFFGFFPVILSPLDSKTNADSGISQILNQPYLNLSGRGVIIGFVDTGIDYTKDAFKFEDGSTKIISIWDQTIDGERPNYLYYGSVYTREQIDLALKSPNPHSIVPTIDEDGHGTFLASVAASNEKGDLIGAAPAASIISVKLRRASEYYIDKYLLPKENPNLFESTDYLLGMKYIFDRSEELNMPVVICIGMGSNMSGHDGNSFMEDYINFASKRSGYTVAAAAGNESNARHHTQGTIPRTGSTDTVSIKVERSNTSFMLTVFGPAHDKISASVTSPSGEVVARLPFKVGFQYSEKLIFENSVITIEYYKDVNNIILLKFQDATEGIWEVTLFGDAIITGEYFCWLPITGQVSPYVELLKPVPDYTIVYPGTSVQAITCGAYNNNDNSLYVSSSWGPTRVPRLAPELAAPGVGVNGIYPTGPGTMTGTSVSAAVTAGAVAILLEWGIVDGNAPSMDGDLISTLLTSGCKREENMIFPNNKWGYGKLDLYGTFSVIKESTINYTLS